MKVIFISPYPTEGPSYRYRVEQYFGYLKKNGINYYPRPFMSSRFYKIVYRPGKIISKFAHFSLSSVLRCIDFFRALTYDIIFIHLEAYPIGPPIFEYLWAKLGKCIIYEFDDAIFLPRTSRPNSFIEKFKNPAKVVTIIKMSSYVITGNQYLADFALKYNENVSVIPTSIDTVKYYPYNKEKANKLVIGWMGSITTIEFLKPMKDVFIKISERFKQVEFRVIGGEFSVKYLPRLLNKPWERDREIGDLMAFDIGIMPMPDNEWTRGKCGFKAILYMSMGIPCVCSPVGVNKEIISDGINGFLVSTEDEWVEKLSFLIKHPEARYDMGIAGRNRVIEKYSLKVNAPIFLDILQKVYYENLKSKL